MFEGFELPTPEREGLIDDDDVPEPEEAITKLGNLWTLGEHRLLCGDATKGEDVERLMDGEKADSIVTDPPFFTPAAHYQSRVKHQRKFADLSTLSGFWEQVHNAFMPYLKSEGHSIVFCNHDSYAVFYPVMFSRYDKTKSLVWDKTRVGLGRIFRNQHELIIWGRNEGHYFKPDGDLHADVLSYAATLSKDREHPVEKPVALLVALVTPLTPQKGVSVDLFAGGGSTLIACEKTGRRCYGMEIDPHYCDVIVNRWEQFTGEKAVLMSTNKKAQ